MLVLLGLLLYVFLIISLDQIENGRTAFGNTGKFGTIVLKIILGLFVTGVVIWCIAPMVSLVWTKKLIRRWISHRRIRG
ncbi:MAG: hypothetical protein A2827_00400 [Candidatus Spechtbacteria bacterium RIFCSPHIGHO2_01_FULL_43_30]|uniref:Uncharacterized protein n=1 Tax=Candidatus Spechtbacteria bacterium RIFCSPHIGHO2_01_FULL_43_30 TaxID=1802158 RepID=A0A1G2H8F2_9BACT|nr:MAG: hypothetical protein A2827_00400 [Candidatus Spechtbacteria bacterium RIFCSPHIGHO2_01_FULL_43_30]